MRRAQGDCAPCHQIANDSGQGNIEPYAAGSQDPEATLQRLVHGWRMHTPLNTKPRLSAETKL